MKRVFRLFPVRRGANAGNALSAEQTPVSYARSPEGEAIIRLRLNSPAALLMPFESFPINFGSDPENEKKLPILNLNKDLVEYLLARVAELKDEPLLLRVTLASEVPAEALHDAICRYFAYQKKARRQSLTKLAWEAVLLGLLGAIALVSSALLDARNTSVDVGLGSLLLVQGVTVFGWLMLWEALANALWNWRPLYQQQQMCQRLQQARFELVAESIEDILAENGPIENGPIENDLVPNKPDVAGFVA